MKNRQFILRQTPVARALAAAFAATLSANAAYAQSTQGAPAQLPDVVVTASSTTQLITDALPHTTLISQADIQRSQATDLTTLLEREAGFQFTHNGGRGLVTGLSLRGAATLQVLLLIDGVPMTKQDAIGGASYEHLMLDQIDRVEIVRGNVSAIYGSGAIGGVVQVFTKTGSKSGGNMTVEVGSRGSKKVSGNVGANLGATKLSAGYSSNQTDGFSAINPAQAAKANPDKDGYKNENWSLAASSEWSKGHTLGLKTTHSTGKSNFDQGLSFDANTDVHTSKTKLDATSVFSENKFTQNWLSKISFAQSKDDNSGKYVTAYGTTVDSYVSNNKTIHWNNTVALNSAWTLTAGLEKQSQSVIADDGYGGTYTKDRTVKAFFAGALGQVGASSFQLNARRDSTDGVDSKTTAYLGYGLALNPNWKITASSSTAFNLVPLGYLYSPYGNPDLVPEIAKSKELGLQYASGRSVMRATLFNTQTNNQLDYDLATYAFTNLKRTKNSGLELSYSTQVGKTDLKGSLTSQKPINVITGETSNRRAKSLAAFSISQPIAQWRLGADVRYTGEVKDGTKALKSYMVLDLSARYDISKTLNAYARIENAANAKYQTVYSYNSAPRGLFLGLNWQPGF